MQLQFQPKFRYFARNGPGGDASHSSAGQAYVGRSQQACRRASTVCHARLPHMDEEIEHMQWQLGKRSLESSNDTRNSNSHRPSAGNHNQGRTSSNSSSRGGKGRAHQHVFHERHVSRHNHLHHHQLHHHRHHHSNSSSSGSSSSSENELTMPAQGNSAAAAGQGPAAAHDVPQASGTTAQQQQQQQDVLQPHQQQQQHHQRHAQQQQQQQHGYYHMQLPLQAAAIDFQKAKERLLKHIMQDGGCYVTAAAAQSSMLTHLLLSLQHKQVLEQPGSILLLQPVNVSTASSSTSAAAAAAAVRGPHEFEWGGSTGAAAVVVGGEHQQHLSGSTEQLDFWLTAMPLDVLLGLMQEQEMSRVQQAAAAVGVDGGKSKTRGSSSITSSSVASASSMSLLDGSFSFSMESSSDDWQSSSTAAYVTTSTGRAASSSTSAVSSSNSSSMTSSRSMDKHGKRGGSSSSSSSAEEALLHAAARSCPASGALLLQALSQQALKCVRVGCHADVHTVASSMVRAIAAGKVESLHVKGHAGAHSIAYTALAMAAAKLSAGFSPKGFGVLLVPGEVHEHVHAVLQGRVGAAQDGLGFEHQHAARAVGDASMSVGGIGAAFYGIGDSSGSGGSRVGDHGLLHKRAQEMWLCVMPLSCG